MVKIKFGAFITDGSGKIGGQTVSSGLSGSYIKNNGTRVKRSSIKQNAVKSHTAYLMQLWSSLSSLAQLQWESIVSDYPYTDVFGSIRHYSGFNMFLKLNQGRFIIGSPPLLNIPQFAKPTLPTMLNVTVTPTAFTIQSSAYSPDDLIQVFATKVLSNGIRKPKRWLRQIGVFTAAQLDSGYDAITEYLAIFPDLVNGDTLWIGSRTISATSGYGLINKIVNQPVIVVTGGSVVYSDNFNRANGGLGVNWQDTLDEGYEPIIVANQVESDGSGDAAAYWVGGTFADNQWSQVTVVDVSGDYSGVILRSNNTSYMVFQQVGLNVQLGFFNNGSWSLVGSVPHTMVDGDVLKLEAIGTTYNGYINGVLSLSETDSNLTSGAAGLLVSNTQVLDNWSGGDV